MDLTLFLSFTDAKLGALYLAERRRPINLLAGMTLLARLISLIYRITSYESRDVCFDERYYLICGIGVHSLAVLLSLRWTLGTRVLSGLVLLSFINVQFCKDD